MDVTFAAAFVAGLLSFLSPCVLPLVPPYMCYMAGTTLDDLTSVDAKKSGLRRQVVLAAVFFVLGFSTVFVTLGATASLIGQALLSHMAWLSKAAGVVIIIMGLHFMGLFRIGALFRVVRHEGPRDPASLFGSYLMGLAFAFGWTPCIGPVLAAILAVAGSKETLSQGATLLSVYSLGLGVPFLLAALLIEEFLRLGHFIKPFMHRLEQVMGALLVFTGVMFLTGWMSAFSFWLLETFPFLAKLG